MKLYAYSIIDFQVETESPMVGLDGGIVYTIPYNDMGIAVSDLHEQHIQIITEDLLLKHEEVVERLMRKGTVLPMKFLTLFKGREDVLSMMRDYYSDFRENLDRLRRKVEFGMKVLWSGDTIREHIVMAHGKNGDKGPLQGDTPERLFLRDRFEKYEMDKEFRREADSCIASINEFLSPFAVERKHAVLRTSNLLLDGYYLVEKERQEDFKKAFERLRKTLSDFKYLFSGPWPPYNFIALRGKSHRQGFHSLPLNTQ